MIELLSILNNNVEELILDLKDIKNTNMITPHCPTNVDTTNEILSNKKHTQNQHSLNVNNSNSSSSSSISNSSCNNSNICSSSSSSINSNSNSNSMITKNCNDNIINNNATHNNTSNNNNQHHMDVNQMQSQNRISINTIDAIDLDSGTLSVSHQHNNNMDSYEFKTNLRLENISPNNESFKTVKTGLREFSTFVSKMVRQEFGCNFLALTRINELDRYTMQRIRDEAVSKYLPVGISPQFAWNHAMNSLRQLRHRQCKKAKLPL